MVSSLLTNMKKTSSEKLKVDNFVGLDCMHTMDWFLIDKRSG